MGSAQQTRNGEMKLICHCLLDAHRKGSSPTLLLPPRKQVEIYSSVAMLGQIVHLSTPLWIEIDLTE